MQDSKKFDAVLLLLRLTFGGLILINHGFGKMMQLFTGDPTKFADLFGLGAPVTLSLAIFAEFFCAIFVILGLFTRWAVMPLIIMLLVAVFKIHFHDPFAAKELAIVYLIPYLCLLLAGAGWYSLDARIRKV